MAVQIEEGDEGEMVRPLDRMPDHVIVSVLRKLSVRERLRAEGVCRRWRRVALDAGWTHVRAISYSALVADDSISAAPLLDADVERQRQSVGLLEAVIVRSDLHELDLSRFLSGSTALPIYHPYGRVFVKAAHSYISEAFVSDMCSRCSPLTTLDLSFISLTNDALRTIGAQFGGQLRSLTMKRCLMSNDSELGLGRLLVDCAHLDSLDISYSRTVTGTSSFAALPITLKSLRVHDSPKLSETALRHVVERCGVILEHLRLYNLLNVSAAAIKQTLGQLGNLRSLKFAWYFPNPQNTDMLFTTVSRLANLHSLDLDDNSLVSDHTLIAMADGCKQLRVLRLYTPLPSSLGITEAGLGALARLPNLTRLSLHRIAALTDEALRAIADRGKLEVLFVCGSSITDAGLQHVALCCKGLRLLDLTEHPRVGDATLLALVALLQRRATNDSLQVWLHLTAVTQPAVAGHANLIVSFDWDSYYKFLATEEELIQALKDVRTR